MALKVGMRVTIKPGVSPCCDEGSLQTMANRGHPPGTGISRERFVGKKGEIVAIDESRGEDCYLVDDQMVTNKDTGKQEPLGSCTMRDWFKASDIEPG